ncbi:DUF397 domain-containing protein [Streptomyces cinnamoneus]|uniref:DUF397 domain-containing protein n=1 Tax=Streptomyces cinnamoneus TaxID=53446 RepID=A0A918TYI2_STRCJ|nr:DUF397 domain-containing protein [Streptomyces cinnamoneus]GHC68754.1 hypothetical protein GCM10010507_54090 [Streptomyces cinnamoneus]
MSGKLDWFKSSYSDDSVGNCVEIARHHGEVHVRDSKLGGDTRITIPPVTWAAFTAELRGSRVERPL